MQRQESSQQDSEQSDLSDLDDDALQTINSVSELITRIPSASGLQPLQRTSPVAVILSKGDHVRVVKDGLERGRIGIVESADFGQITISMLPDFAQMSYLPTEVEKVDPTFRFSPGETVVVVETQKLGVIIELLEKGQVRVMACKGPNRFDS